MRPHGRKPKGQTKPGTLRSLHVLWSLLFMCLCMCMFLYMSISCTHIVDISYPSRSGIPLKVDTVSTMNSSRSPSNSFVVALPSITTLPEPAMFLQDSQSTLPESSLLTAVLPVTSSSVSHLGPIIRTLLIHSRYLTEVILVSPQSIQTEIRRVLRSIVAAEGQWVHVELSLLPWPPNMNEDAAILHVSRQATTDFILFLDDSGLELVGTRALESLMLLEPPSVAAPFGPRGINSTDTGLTCISTEEDFRPASFLVPPYVMPSFLLPQHDLNPDNVFGVWSALGKHITQTQIERDMVGGFVVGYQIESTNAGWCPSEILQSNHSLQLEYVDSHKSRPFDEVGDSSTDGSREPPSNPTSPPNPHSFGVFALVLPSLRDLRSFSAAACRLQHAGHTIKSLLYAEEQNPDFITNNEDLHLLSDECDLGYDAFFSAESTSKELADILDWFSCLSPVPDVVIASSHKEGHLVLGIPFQEQSSSHVISVLQIAQEDLPYCDWMGTLTLQEFKNWHVPRVDISVITNNRPHSLTRLLSSLSSARYFGDTLNLRINIEQTADAETLQVVDDFQWVRGGLFIHHRIIHGGLLPAIVESWYPHSNDSYGLILEDDVELSPLFYAWIKLSLLHYRYSCCPYCYISLSLRGL
ncbi:hypothetical protein AcW2_005410 [Taiwanofungus camphoratus]|nr:hypothetical protein AcW2_005410 [Antrodia cinnamomea]